MHGVSVIGWSTFLRFGDVEFPNWFLLGSATLILLVSWVRVFFVSRILVALATVAAAYGLGHSILFAYGIRRVAGATTGIGLFLTLGAFVVLLALSSANLAADKPRHPPTRGVAKEK
jgi:hypothetical protein